MQKFIPIKFSAFKNGPHFNYPHDEMSELEGGAMIPVINEQRFTEDLTHLQNLLEDNEIFHPNGIVEYQEQLSSEGYQT